jgi:hypothetical protein
VPSRSYPLLDYCDERTGERTFRALREQAAEKVASLQPHFQHLEQLRREGTGA